MVSVKGAICKNCCQVEFILKNKQGAASSDRMPTATVSYLAQLAMLAPDW